MEREIKNTYEEWWEGKIYFGGEVSGDVELVEQFKREVPLASFSKLLEEDKIRVVQKRKEIFNEKVNKRFEEVKNFFLKDLPESSEKEKLIDGLIKDLEFIFYSDENIPSNYFHKPKFLKNIFFNNELERVREFHHNHNVLGKRDYSFIQSPHLSSRLFEINQIEIYSEMLYRFMKWLIKEKDYLIKPEKVDVTKDGKQVALNKIGFELSDEMDKKFKNLDTDLDNLLSIFRVELKSPKNKFILESTNQPNFKRVFLGKEVESKIIWIGSVKELSVFIKELIKKKFIKNPQKEIWEKTIYCFEKIYKGNKVLTIAMLTRPGPTKNKKRETKIKDIIPNIPN